MNWKSAADRVVIERIPQEGERKTDAGIFLPEKSGSQLSKGVVLAAGPDANGVLPGDTVFVATKEIVPLEGKIGSIYASSILGINREEA